MWKLKDVINTFCNTKPYFSLKVNIVFCLGQGDKVVNQRLEDVKQKYGDLPVNRFDMSNDELTFFVGENDEDW